MKFLGVSILLLAGCASIAAEAPAPSVTSFDGTVFTLRAGDPSLAVWQMPAHAPHPQDNAPTSERISLGEMLFFDARLSVHGKTSCGTCHMPERAWADGVPRSARYMQAPGTRNSPTVVNAAFNQTQNWDGRNRSLEQQATGSQSLSGATSGGAKEAGVSDPELGIERIRKIAGYRDLFAKAYPGEPINQATAGKAIASFERTLVSKDTPFDRWVQGDTNAMTPNQVNGFRVFLEPVKGNCAVCHSAPFFTDHGFHNIGLRQFGAPDADAGRHKVRPVVLMKGAFKTPMLREVSHTAPYFHDGSANSLRDVVEHYARGGDVKTNLSPNMKTLALSEQEKADLVAFLQALGSPATVHDYPRLPR